MHVAYGAWRELGENVVDSLYRRFSSSTKTSQRQPEGILLLFIYFCGDGNVRLMFEEPHDPKPFTWKHSSMSAFFFHRVLSRKNERNTHMQRTRRGYKTWIHAWTKASNSEMSPLSTTYRPISSPYTYIQRIEIWRPRNKETKNENEKSNSNVYCAQRAPAFVRARWLTSGWRWLLADIHVPSFAKQKGICHTNIAYCIINSSKSSINIIFLRISPVIFMGSTSRKSERMPMCHACN